MKRLRRVTSTMMGALIVLTTVLAGWAGSAGTQPALAAATITVNSTADTATDTGECTLREAITAANSNSASGLSANECAAGSALGTDTIQFNIGGGGAQTILLGSLLPTISSAVLIDGTTQPSYAGTPLITLDANNTGTGFDLTAGSTNSTINGIIILRPGTYGIHATTNGLTFKGNYIGTDGASDWGGNYGIWIEGDNNQIGGTGTNDGNVIAGSNQADIQINAFADNTIIQGNIIGTDTTGATAIDSTGIGVGAGGPGTQIGGTTAGSGNLISGNYYNISQFGIGGNTIQGNKIGTNLAGTAAVSGSHYGIGLTSSSNNTVGGAAAGASNLISGNSDVGIYIQNNDTTGNVIKGNLIGTNAAGTAAIANGIGIWSEYGINSTIGGGAAGEGNLISGNTGAGVYLHGGGGSTLKGNKIGVNAAGTAALANAKGVQISGSLNNTLGGTLSGERNVISGNTGIGVLIEASASGNTVSGNYIGSDAAGTAALANHDGVLVESSNNVTINGGNVISGNVQIGVQITSSTGNAISGNIIGADAAGSGAMQNGTAGIYLTSSTSSQVAGNLVANHSGTGIYLDTVSVFAASSTQNCIVSNSAGVDNTTGSSVTFENNWWGNASGPSGSGPGTGDSVSTDVDFTPWLASPSAGCEPLGPGAPTTLAAVSNGTAEIDLTWNDNSTTETSYSVERSPDGSTNWVEIATPAADATSYQDMSVVCGTTYHYRVRAYRSTDTLYSAYSNSDSATTDSCTISGPRCYVDWDAAGPTHDGSSWTNGLTDLQQALTSPNCTEVWVAAGVYKPDGASPGNQALSFQLLDGVEVYGGFAGTETLLSQRNWEANPTILSGDIDNNDDTNNADGNSIDETYLDLAGSNSYHVVLMDGQVNHVTSSTILDGFILTGGRASGSGPQNEGGGLLCDASDVPAVCSPTLRNLTVIGNRAGFGGGMMSDAYGGQSNPSISNVAVTGNYGEQNGGGFFNYVGNSGTASPSLSGVTFLNNTTGYRGGGMQNGISGGTGSPTLTNVTFRGNSAEYGGGLSTWSLGSGTGNPTLRNVTFSLNTARLGGGMNNDVETIGSVNATLINVILWGNSVSGIGAAGPEVYNEGGGTAAVSYSVVQGSGGSGGGWDASVGTDGGNNLDANPMLGPIADNGGTTQTMALQAGSSAIDTGDDGTCAAAPVSGFDQRGITRPRGPHCDIGAYERIRPSADFEADYGSDLGYFRASTGVWGVLQSSQAFSYGNPLFFSWGTTGDLMVRGDFDGDGRNDPTVRKPPASGQSAAYRMLLSSTGYDFNSALTVPAGWPGLNDTPAVGDFNGDGIDDPAIFRGNTGVWIIPLSPNFNTYQFYSWGTSGDKPVTVDIDGDGQTDIGYWRPSTGVWGFLTSVTGYSYGNAEFFSWGASTDIPVAADYDGDGLADIAVVIPASGGQSRAYRILLSTQNYSAASSLTLPAGWAGLGDVPVPQDYDGDGKADAGIWRGNTGVWIIPESSTDNSTYLFAAWGASGDEIVK